MNEVNWLRRLDSAAPPDTPRVDVSARVLRSIRSRRGEEETVLPIAAFVAVAAGVCAVALAAPAWLTARDPFASLAEVFNVLLQ